MGAVAEEFTPNMSWHAASQGPVDADLDGGVLGAGVNDGVAGSQERDLTPLGLITVIVVTVVTNLSVCIVVKVDRRLHHMTFYFFVSLAMVHLLMAATVMPLAVIVVLAGKLTRSMTRSGHQGHAEGQHNDLLEGIQ